MLWIDLETYCDVPIKFGTYRYAEAAEVMLVAYAVGNARAAVWDLTAGECMPDELAAALAEEYLPVCAHNAQFDRVVWNSSSVLPHLTTERWRCSMVKAYAHSLPGGLDKLCEVLGVPAEHAKEKDGRNLIRLFCMPPPKSAKNKERATGVTHPEEWARFVEYARLDVEAMREVWKRSPSWNYPGE